MHTEPEIADSARKHGVSDEDMLAVYRHPLQRFDQDEALPMLVGFGLGGSYPVLEVGISFRTGRPRIVHAMPARPKYLRNLRR